MEPWLPSPPPSRSPRRRPSPAARFPSGTGVVRARARRVPSLPRHPRVSREIATRRAAKTPLLGSWRWRLGARRVRPATPRPRDRDGDRTFGRTRDDLERLDRPLRRAPDPRVARGTSLSASPSRSLSERVLGGAFFHPSASLAPATAAPPPLPSIVPIADALPSFPSLSLSSPRSRRGAGARAQRRGARGGRGEDDLRGELRRDGVARPQDG